MLEDAGIKLATVARDVLGMSGRAMLEALVQGTRDPAVLAELARGRMRAKLPALRQALAGHFRPHHAFLTTQILAHLDHLEEAVATLSARIEAVLAPFSDETTYQELGADYYDRRHTEHVARRAVQMLEQQGYRVTLEPVA